MKSNDRFMVGLMAISMFDFFDGRCTTFLKFENTFVGNVVRITV